MTNITGCTKIQKNPSKKYANVIVPKTIEKHLDTFKGANLGWIGVTIGTEEDNEDIAVCFIVDKWKDPTKQFRRILKLLGE